MTKKGPTQTDGCESSDDNMFSARLRSDGETESKDFQQSYFVLDGSRMIQFLVSIDFTISVDDLY